MRKGWVSANHGDPLLVCSVRDWISDTSGSFAVCGAGNCIPHRTALCMTDPTPAVVTAVGDPRLLAGCIIWESLTWEGSISIFFLN